MTFQNTEKREAIKVIEQFIVIIFIENKYCAESEFHFT